MAALGGDRRLIEAHQTAVAEALQEIELQSGARVRRGGAQNDRTTGNLVIALYHHDTSRELDPQLHTHAVAANLTYDGTEGRWKALQASGIYERRSYLTEVYRNALAREVRKLGYGIEGRQNTRGRDKGFEIKGVPDDLIAKYSQRSRQRDKAIRQFVARTGRRPTDNEIAILVRDSRPDKLVEISTKDVQKRQLSRLTPEESRALEGVQHGRGSIPTTPDRCVASLEYARDHIFERVSVAKDYEILTEALRHGRGHIRCEELKRLLRLEESAGLILRKGDEIATAASLKREREMIDCINRGIGARNRLGGEKPFNPSNRLNSEQNRVLEFVLNSRDQTVNIRGAAGTGKTATLRELQRTLLESGHEVMAVAPTMSAVEELQKVEFKGASTIERLLQDQRAQAALSQKVLIVDEAGMVSGRQMWELLKIAERHSARVIFSGDTKQIQSVEACDALRVLEKESRLKSIELIQVQRQTVKKYREAIKELRRDPTVGFEKLDNIGAIHEVPWLDRARAVAQAFAEAELKRWKALVVCATHEEIDRVTEAIRSRRKRIGQLGKSVEIGRNISLNWTTAQKSEMRNFRPGQLLVFHRPVKGIAKNQTVEVAQVSDNQILVRNPQGKSRALTAKQAKSFDVCERSALDVAPGDKLLITSNRRTSGFKVTNGEIVTVDRIDQHGFIGLNDGRVVPPDFRQFTYGYAVTAHRSQGKSVDEVIISADGMKKELFYVAASRGRESVRIITSDKNMLRDTVGQSNARQSASELARSIRPGLHQGMNRGFAAACKLARWAARHVSHLRKPFALAKQSAHQPIMESTHDWSIG